MANLFEMTSCKFVKFMGPNFSQILTFPMNVVMNFKKVAEVITLEGPSGNRWLVRLSNIGGHTYLKEGWKEFVEANHVEEGDCLVFEYCGSSCFSVLIFDRSGCEREASYFVRIMNPKKYQTEEDHERQLPVVLKFSSPSLPCDDNSPLQVIPGDEKGSSFRAKSDCRKFSIRLSSPNDKSKYEHTIQSKKVEEHSAKHGAVNMQEGQTTGLKLKAEVRSLRSTKAIRAETPYFTKYLLPSHLSGSSFFMGKMWSVKYEVKEASGRGSVTGLSGRGWRSFVLENELDEGDGCIFVLSGSPKEKVFDVYIVWG